MSLRDKIKAARQKKGLSQQRLAKTLGYSSGQFVSNWERGLSYPPVDRLAKMILIFDLNEEEILNQYIKELIETKKKVFNKALEFHKSRAESQSQD